MHKKIGIIGGLSPESTVSYYLHITRAYIEKFGDCGYPEIIIYSVNLEHYHSLRRQNRWDLITAGLATAAESLRGAGAEFGLIATNTMHQVFNEVEAATSLPLLHILDPTIAAIKRSGIHTVGLLGTRYTMQETFYKDRLKNSQLGSLVPDEEDQKIIDQIIMNELTRGKISPSSRGEYLKIIEKLRADGAAGIILGCTEIPLLIRQEDTDMPIFDTAVLHAQMALDLAIQPRD